MHGQKNIKLSNPIFVTSLTYL